MPAQPIHIRKANSDDLPFIKDCARQAYARYLERMDREPAPMVADFKQQISDGIVSVATHKHRLAGFIVFYIRTHHMHLENVAVLPEFTGQGIGKALILHVEQASRTAGKDSIELYTNEAMHENFGLYEHLGYREIERKEESGFKRVFYSKTIS